MRCHRPLELVDQHLLVAQAPGAANDDLDGGVERLDRAEAHRVVAVGGDAVKVAQRGLPEPAHFGELPPPECTALALEDVCDTTARLIRPQFVQLLAQDVGLEQPTVGVEEFLQLAPPESAHLALAVQKQPSLVAPDLAHDWPSPGPEELPSARLGDNLGRVLQDVELPDDLAVHEIREDRRVLLPPAARNLIGAEMTRRNLERPASHSPRNAFSARRASPHLTRKRAPWHRPRTPLPLRARADPSEMIQRRVGSPVLARSHTPRCRRNAAF